MPGSTETSMMMVSLNEATVAALLSMRSSHDETMDILVRRLMTIHSSQRSVEGSRQPQVSRPKGAKYGCEVMGHRVYAQNLPLLFAAVIDAFSELAPDILHRFAEKKAQSRRFISLDRDQVHDRRPDLGVMRTRSGWWVSTNVGMEDVVRGLRVLCKVADLKYGTDIRVIRL